MLTKVKPMMKDLTRHHLKRSPTLASMNTKTQFQRPRVIRCLMRKILSKFLLSNSPAVLQVNQSRPRLSHALTSSKHLALIYPDHMSGTQGARGSLQLPVEILGADCLALQVVRAPEAVEDGNGLSKEPYTKTSSNKPEFQLELLAPGRKDALAGVVVLASASTQARNSEKFKLWRPRRS